MTTSNARDIKAPAGSGARVTRRQNAEHGFTASKTLTDNMQKVLVDLLELHLALAGCVVIVFTGHTKQMTFIVVQHLAIRPRP